MCCWQPCAVIASTRPRLDSHVEISGRTTIAGPISCSPRRSVHRSTRRTPAATFKKICAHAGVPALSLYEIRHTVASLMVDADVPLREVADLLGHKDLEMVVKRYRHRTDGVVTSHVSVLGSLIAE